MEDEYAGRKSKQQNGGVYEDSKHKQVERTQRWVRSVCQFQAVISRFSRVYAVPLINNGKLLN